MTEVNNQNVTSNPLDYTNTFSGYQTVNSQDFCIASSIVGQDAEVIIIPTSDARPGFNSNYRIIYKNNGDKTISGSINLNFDNAKVNYTSSSPSENSTTSNSITWNYSNLLPLETRFIDVYFNINTPPTVNNGENLPFTVTINPISGDANTTNNTFTLNQTTIGSYDPNDAAILQGPLISSSQATEDLYFRIRFQNTGTASAINVNVKTILDTDLDWTTFEPIYASHAYSTLVNNTTGEVNFKFDNINLADSNTDEPNSHGYLLFKAKTISGFAVGDVVECTADIFFDYNLPIITNTATTQIDNTFSVVENQDDNILNIYPNTTNRILLINLEDSASFSLFNLNGQLVRQGNFTKGENHYDISNLDNGLYLIKIITSKGKTFANKVYKK